MRVVGLNARLLRGPSPDGVTPGKDLSYASSAAYLVHERSGERLSVPSTPKAGALRTTGVPQAGRSYFALFSNPSGRVQRGDKVSIVLGELTATLIVE